jgi:hypothetical protein
VLPVQLSVLEVPNPAVTPTNLLFNVVSIPGALARYRQRAPASQPVDERAARRNLAGRCRRRSYGGCSSFRGRRCSGCSWQPCCCRWGCGFACVHTAGHLGQLRFPPSKRFIAAIALGTGVVGGIYGIGGGSLLSPILVGRGVPVNTVAPAALTSTFIVSVAGAMTYLLLAIFTVGRGHCAGVDDRDCVWPPRLVRRLLRRAPTTVPT